MEILHIQIQQEVALSFFSSQGYHAIYPSNVKLPFQIPQWISWHPRIACSFEKFKTNGQKNYENSQKNYENSQKNYESSQKNYKNSQKIGEIFSNSNRVSLFTTGKAGLILWPLFAILKGQCH